MKKGLYVVASAYVGFVVYALLTFFFGRSGIARLNEMEQHRALLERNIIELEDIGVALENKRDALLHDTEEIAMLARRLGYFKNSDVRVITPDRTFPPLSRTLGKMIGQYSSPSRSTTLYRAIGFSSSLFTIIVCAVLFFRKNDRIDKRR